MSAGASDQEYRERLSAIQEGPWSHGLGTALHRLRPAEALPIDLAVPGMLALDTLALSKKNQARAKAFESPLRLHYEDAEDVEDDQEIAIRDAFDDALTVPQLYELAIQTGYLPEDAVRQPGRELLAALLWSPAARRYVEGYDYLSVSMLAARLGVSGLAPARYPQPDARSAVRFAGFLAHLRELHADERIVDWLSFMDDYVPSDAPHEQEDLWKYLRGATEEAPRRTPRLMTGCMLFVVSMYTAFNQLEDDELGRFGLVHAYWLAKFLGFELGERGYVRDTASWDAGDSWARTFVLSPRLFEGENAQVGAAARESLTKQVELLRHVFDQVKKLAGKPAPA